MIFNLWTIDVCIHFYDFVEPNAQVPNVQSVLDPEDSFIINANNSDSTKFAIELPMISRDNGPFRLVYN